MMKFLTYAIMGLMLAAGAHRISSIEQNGPWIYLYDDSGRKYKTLSADNVGEVLGYSSTFFVSRSRTWIYLWDSEGVKYKSLSASTIGEVTSVIGDTFTSRNGAWIYTWDSQGRKINKRAAR